MVAMGHLSSGVAHEINNPLGGITICFKSLLKFTKKTPETDELVFAVEDGLQKINNIVTQLLGLSRSSIVEKKPVDINKLIHRLLVLFRHEAEKQKIEICLELDESLPLVFADDNKIAQVFMNLTINAIQAMGDSGSLTISTRREGFFCNITFSDTGEGIHPENMPFIFDPFFTTKKTGKGTGLGLSVSRGIIEKHDGTLSAESEPGRGATFTIRLHALPEPLQDVKEVTS
jgi:signal transduction histidine kinase